jgi:RHS repeat-associated protein
VSNQIIKALEHGAQKMGKAIGEDAGKAVKDFYQDTGTRLKKVAENHVENDAKHAAEMEKLLKGGGKEDLPHAPGGRSARPGSSEEPSLAGTSRPGQSSEGNGSCTTGGDPVDVVSGQMITSATDLTLPGLLPLVLRRSYASGYTGGRHFGPGWSSTLDQRVQIDSQAIHYAGDDGQILHYPRPTATDHPVLPEHGARWPLTWDDATGTIRIQDPATGWTRHFETPPDGAATRPITALTDRNGHHITYTHDTDGLPTAVEHSGGYRVAVDTIHTGAGPRIEAIRLLDGTNTGLGTTVITYRYDPLGRLTDIVNSSGLPLVYAHDTDDRITSWTDRNGHWYEYEYGPNGRVTRGVGSGGALEASFDYNTQAHVTTVINSLGHRTEHHYDEHGHITRTVDPAGNTVHSEHDRHGRLLSYTDELGHTTRYSLDADGEPVRIDRPDGTTVTVTYNEGSLPIRVDAGDGAVWRYEYDARGNLLATTDPAGATTTYVYDERGHRLSRTDALGGTARYRTNGAGLPIQVRTPQGSTVELERDAFGRVVSRTDPVGGKVRQGWNVAGDPLWRVAEDSSREEWAYDPEGNLTEHRHQTGHTTVFEYGPFDIPRLRIDPDGARYEFTHDTELRLTAVTNPQGLSWRYLFDATGCLISETDFNGRTLHYNSDKAGRLTERVNGTGQTVSLTRDAAGRVVSSRTDDGAESTYNYDSAGRLTRATTPDCALEYAYDAVGRIVTESIDGRVLASEYDPLGRRIRRVTPTGSVSEWTYDVDGLPATLATLGGGLTFQYDAAGRETMRRFGNTVAMTQVWDSAHQLVGQAIWAQDAAATGSGSAGPGSIRLQARTYAYRADGQPTEIADQLSGTRHFELDPAGRVTAVRASAWAETYAYDELGNLAHAAYPDRDDDAQGPREHSGTLVRRAGRTVYQHDGQGRVVSAVRRSLSGKERIWRYSWDAEDRLKTAVTPDGAVWHYRYDALGRRVSKIRTAAADAGGSIAEEILFSWDGTTLAEQRTLRPGIETSVTWDWDPGTHRATTQLNRTWSTEGSADGIPRAEIDRRFHAIVTDVIGTPRELVTLDGRIAWRGSTTLWGRSAGADEEELDCPLRFPGQYHDAETGLNYNLARYYDPDTASYASPDPLGLHPAPNHHGYVDNPLSWLDPLGLTGKRSTRIYDDKDYTKHGGSATASGKGEISRAPSNGQAALDRSIDLDPSNPNVTRRLGVDHENNEIVVLDRHREIIDKDGNITEVYHGHVQSTYPSKSVTQGDLTKLKKEGMIDNIKKQRVLPPPPPCEK